MMKRMLWMLGGMVLTVGLAVGVYFVVAGNIDSSQVPDNVASRMYTLKNIYDFITAVDSAVPAKSTSTTFVEPSAGPGSTMNTTDQIFANLTRFPATGQTTSYATGDDGDLEMGATKRYGDYIHGDEMPDGTAIPDGVTYDYNTGLMWARDGNGAGCFSGGAKTWSAAVTWANDLDFAGYTDWRLPNVYELYSICKLESTIVAPFIDTTYFPNTQSFYYWSSTTYPALGGTDYALNVDFSVGSAYGGGKGGVYFVRAVRGGH